MHEPDTDIPRLTFAEIKQAANDYLTEIDDRLATLRARRIELNDEIRTLVAQQEEAAQIQRALHRKSKATARS